jgi:uncharacterized membrane protein YuzA (DUF378 family)
MMRILGKVVWVITALVSLNIASAAFLGFDIFAMVPDAALMPLVVVIGLSGLLSLWMFISMCCGMSKGCGCCSECKPN